MFRAFTSFLKIKYMTKEEQWTNYNLRVWGRVGASLDGGPAHKLFGCVENSEVCSSFCSFSHPLRSLVASFCRNLPYCFGSWIFRLLEGAIHNMAPVGVCGSIKGELNPEMKLSQSIELFVTKRLPPIRSLFDIWFSSCASWKSAATPPEFGRDTPFWRHWHSDWPGGDREKVVFRTFRKSQHFQAESFQQAFVGPFYASNDGFWKLWHFFIVVWRRFCSHFFCFSK